MAVDKAVVNVNASLLPDNVKISIGGTTIYNRDDTGNNNRWLHFRGMTNGTTAGDLVHASDVQYVNQGVSSAYGGSLYEANEANDDVVFIFIKNSGYLTTSTEASSTGSGTISTADLYIGLSGGDLAANSGTIVIGPGECWYAKLRGEALQDINCAASAVVSLAYDVYAILDVGGV